MPAAKKEAPPTMYCVHSMVMSVHTRTRRHQLSGKRRWVQYLGGGEITIRRKRSATITEEQLRKHLKEIQEKEAQGMLEVRTPGGEKVDLATLKAVPTKKAPPKRSNPKAKIVDEPVIELSPVEVEQPSPEEFSTELSRGEKVVTHSEESDPVKKRKTARRKKK